MTDAQHLETGFVAVSAPVEPVRRWVAGGAVSAYVVGAPSWTLVVPVPEVALPEPYGHPAPLVAGRRLGRGMVPAFGMFVIGPRAVITLQGSALVRRIRWSAWSPGRGAERMPGLHPLLPPHLVRAAPAPVADALPRLEHAFARRDGTADRFVRRVLGALNLPGEDLVRDPGSVRSLAGAELVTPSPQALQRFLDTTRDRAELRAELRAGQEES